MLLVKPEMLNLVVFEKTLKIFEGVKGLVTFKILHFLLIIVWILIRIWLSCHPILGDYPDFRTIDHLSLLFCTRRSPNKPGYSSIVALTPKLCRYFSN